MSLKSVPHLLGGHFSGWHSRHSQINLLCRDQANALLDEPRLRGNSHIANFQETLRGHRCHSGDFQEIKFLGLESRQDFLDCPADHLFFVKTEDRRSDFTSQATEVPISNLDVSSLVTAVK